MKPEIFMKNALRFARNPLGIIALFIVMVYALASLVISLAKPEFYLHPYHPCVVFLSAFPLCVLATFAYLVAKHHEKLYGPSDYENQQDFKDTFKLPQSLTGKTGVATSESVTRAVAPDVTGELSRRYEAAVASGYCMIHEARMVTPRTSPRSGRFEARIWIEAITDKSLSDIRAVTYKVWHDFDPDTYRTEERGSNFDLWLKIYGEFPVIALVELNDGASIYLERYLDLPTRPQD